MPVKACARPSWISWPMRVRSTSTAASLAEYASRVSCTASVACCASATSSSLRCTSCGVRAGRSGPGSRRCARRTPAGRARCRPRLRRDERPARPARSRLSCSRDLQIQRGAQFGEARGEGRAARPARWWRNGGCASWPSCTCATMRHCCSESLSTITAPETASNWRVASSSMWPMKLCSSVSPARRSRLPRMTALALASSATRSSAARSRSRRTSSTSRSRCSAAPITPAAVSSAASSGGSMARCCRVLSKPTMPMKSPAMKIGTMALVCVPTPSIPGEACPAGIASVLRQTLRPARSSRAHVGEVALVAAEAGGILQVGRHALGGPLAHHDQQRLAVGTDARLHQVDAIDARRLADEAEHPGDRGAARRRPPAAGGWPARRRSAAARAPAATR